MLIRSVVELEATPALDHQLLHAGELKDVVAWLGVASQPWFVHRGYFKLELE